MDGYTMVAVLGLGFGFFGLVFAGLLLAFGRSGRFKADRRGLDVEVEPEQSARTPLKPERRMDPSAGSGTLLLPKVRGRGKVARAEDNQ